MSEEKYPFLIEEAPVTKNRFPIVAQLAVLAFILVSLFSTILFTAPEGENAAQPATVAEPLRTVDTAFTPQKLEDVLLTADAAYVWDVAGQRALYSENADEVLPLASLTKLMTALLAYELVSNDTSATISLSAIMQEGSSGLEEGESLDVADLQKLALIASSNDAAYALAASVGNLLGEQDPTAQFIAGMNVRAEELGLSTLNFKSTTGLDLSLSEAGAVGSARDMSFLMEYIVTNYPEILEPTRRSSARIYNEDGGFHDVNNTNEIIPDIPNLIGSKTGYTDLAGGNLIVAFDAGLNRPIIITVLGSTRQERFTDVLTLVAAVQATLPKE